MELPEVEQHESSTVQEHCKLHAFSDGSWIAMAGDLVKLLMCYWEVA